MRGTLDMVAPTIMFVNDHEGGYWEVTYAGMVRQHRQDWQAFTFYEMARALYNTHKAFSNSSGDDSHQHDAPDAQNL